MIIQNLKKCNRLNDIFSDFSQFNIKKGTINASTPFFALEKLPLSLKIRFFETFFCIFAQQFSIPSACHKNELRYTSGLSRLTLVTAYPLPLIILSVNPTPQSCILRIWYDIRIFNKYS